ncbi:MAG: bifunctional glutamate N-acetyltransferase/amino-acid acetyltransferase ArgJ [Gammaproteobacteria bacterium]
MAVGKNKFPKMQPIAGVKLGTACAGIKQTERDDVLVVEMAENSTCAGVFTKNAFCAAPVIVAKQNLARRPRWLLINSGNANAGTGERGLQDAFGTCRALADLAGGTADRVLPFSTGVIGEILPSEKIIRSLPSALSGLSEDNWPGAARAIMTTDTFAKGASKIIDVDGGTVSITGIAKGAGMIQPDMATMLAFIATDARVEAGLLQRCLRKAVNKTFNLITVDGDTSTNDACILMASGSSKAPAIDEESPFFETFCLAVEEICAQLAEAIVRDGEGATKLIRIVIENAKDDEEAARVGKTIAQSPLVKTAFFAGDPNWGRILAAVGRSGLQDLDLNGVVIHLGKVCIVRDGGRAEDYTEEAGWRVMAEEEIKVIVSLGRGLARQEVLTCDFSYDYVRINAEYRT